MFDIRAVRFGILLMAGGCVLGFCVGGAEYPHASLGEAFKAVGFDPSKEGSAYFVACTDSHIRMGTTESFPSYIIDETNAMNSAPAFLVVTGDMISSASLSFGNVPNAKQRETALSEFGILKRDLGRLKPGIPVHFTGGNHDTYPGEKDLAMLRSVFPSQLPYSTEELAGVRLFFLNGGSSGDFDPAQQKWLNAKVVELDPDRACILFVHQPSLGSVVRERGIGEGILAAFSAHRGRLWMLAGHGHHNRDTVFALPETTITQAAMTTCNPDTWGGPEHPGYWVYCLRDGQVVGRVFRRKDVGYRVGPIPATSSPRPLPVAFEGLPVIRKVMVGEESRQYVRTGKAADVLTWWGYIRELVYELPLEGLPATPLRLAVLASLQHNHKDETRRGTLQFSSDGTQWENVVLSAPSNGSYLIPIPDELRSGTSLFVRIAFPHRSEGSLGGFAFCGE